MSWPYNFDIFLSKLFTFPIFLVEKIDLRNLLFPTQTLILVKLEFFVTKAASVINFLYSFISFPFNENS